MISRIKKYLSPYYVNTILNKTNNFIRGSLGQNIFYLHIPKCGGTSLNKALQSHYINWNIGESSSLFNLDASASWITTQKITQQKLSSDEVDDSKVMQFREELLLYYMSQPHIKYISGHFAFSDLAYDHYADKYVFLTVLREPVERWISSYLYNRFRQPDKYRQINMSIEEYLQSDFGISQGYEYAKFLGGADKNGNFMTEEAVKRAKENLHKFHLIGFLDNLEAFKQQFKAKFGKELKMNVLNKRPENSPLEKAGSPIANDLLKEQIRHICQPDIEVYNYAIEHFKK